MRKKIFLWTVILFSVFACERKPLYLQGDVALRVTVKAEADLDKLWKEGWRDSLKYSWDENMHGPLGYTLPSGGTIVIFKEGSIVSESSIKIGKKETIDVELDQTYDLVAFSKEYYWVDTYYEGGRYYIEAPTTSSPSTTNAVSHEYETVNQPGEVFSANRKEIYIPNNISEFEEAVINGKLVYVYNVDEKIEPVSYIYVIQFIVINDDNSPIIEAQSIRNITVSGISTKKNLFNNTPVYTGNKQISTFDIKPGQMKGSDSLVFASRVTVLDLLPDDTNSSWYSQLNYLYYTNVDVNTYNYGEVTGTKDITQQLKDNPKGGVITVVILNSELKKNNPDGSRGFGIDLNEWEQHIFDVF